MIRLVKKMSLLERFKDARGHAIFFTILYIVWICTVYCWNVFDFEEVLGVLIVVLGYLLIPISVFFWWGMCIGVYFYAKAKEEKDASYKWWFLWEIINVVAMLGFGAATIYCFVDLIDYYTGYWRLMDDLSHCIGIKLGMIIGCLFGLVGSIKARNVICTKGNIGKKIIIIAISIVLVVILRLCFVWQDEYTYNEKEDIWFKRMVEHYEEHGSGPDAEPFLWN